jgi:hypothetical protein
MAIASVGTLGTGASSTSNSTLAFNTATNALAAGDFAILTIVSDNTSTGADGDASEITGVSGGTGTWTKLGEHGNNNGAAGTGVVTAVWLFEASGTVAIGTTITVTFANNRTDKCCSFWKYTKAAGTTIVKETGTTNPITSAVDASNGFGSSAFSGLASSSRLYFRGLGKEANSTTDITVSGSFTAITLTRSRNNASAVLLRGEFRINTSTGETSNPTLAVSGDTAGLFLALEESLATINGTLSVTLDDATLSAAGSVAIAGALSATLDDATLAATGALGINGALSVTLDDATMVATGTQSVTPIVGTLAVTLDDATLNAAGSVAITGIVNATLDDAVLSASGSVAIRGAVSATLDDATLMATGTIDGGEDPEPDSACCFISLGGGVHVWG